MNVSDNYLEEEKVQAARIDDRVSSIGRSAIKCGFKMGGVMSDDGLAAGATMRPCSGLSVITTLVA